MVSPWRFPLSEGGFVLIEVTTDPKVVRVGTPADKVATAASSLPDVLEPIRRAADDTLRTLRDMATEPSRIEVQFGVRLTAEADAIVVHAGAQANLQVTLVWEKGR